MFPSLYHNEVMGPFKALMNWELPVENPNRLVAYTAEHIGNAQVQRVTVNSKRPLYRLPDLASLYEDWWCQQNNIQLSDPYILPETSERAIEITRNCETCSKSGYHSMLFEVPWIKTCPLHGCKLIDKCPMCDQRWPSWSKLKTKRCSCCGSALSFGQLKDFGAFQENTDYSAFQICSDLIKQHDRMLNGCIFDTEQCPTYELVTFFDEYFPSMMVCAGGKGISRVYETDMHIRTVNCAEKIPIEDFRSRDKYRVESHNAIWHEDIFVSVRRRIEEEVWSMKKRWAMQLHSPLHKIGHQDMSEGLLGFLDEAVLFFDKFFEAWKVKSYPRAVLHNLQVDPQLKYFDLTTEGFIFRNSSSFELSDGVLDSNSSQCNRFFEIPEAFHRILFQTELWLFFINLVIHFDVINALYCDHLSPEEIRSMQDQRIIKRPKIGLYFDENKTLKLLVPTFIEDQDLSMLPLNSLAKTKANAINLTGH